MADVGSGYTDPAKYTRRTLRHLEEEMNKLSALSKLAGAYHHFITDETQKFVAGDMLAAGLLSDKFHYIRRSLTLADLKPQPKQTAEGYNGRMPTHF